MTDSERNRLVNFLKNDLDRYDLVGEYDFNMEPIEDGDYVKYDDILEAILLIERKVFDD